MALYLHLTLDVEFKMKITNEVNSNADILSNSNKENNNASLLGSLILYKL